MMITIIINDISINYTKLIVIRLILSLITLIVIII
ncbi:unnamed protein product [Brugia timori]|uniref:Uncharacterized protein n=1 Tax=Brugia timori TaxID=42155 RepID=A0A0R3R791_9BILA|nr:unnamed protein product [Brugia timori]